MKIEIRGYSPYTDRRVILGRFTLVEPNGERLECRLLQDRDGYLDIERYNRSEPEPVPLPSEQYYAVLDALTKEHNRVADLLVGAGIEKIDTEPKERGPADRTAQRRAAAKLLTECGFENVEGIYWTKGVKPPAELGKS
jgi:hypothetical protein